MKWGLHHAAGAAPSPRRTGGASWLDSPPPQVAVEIATDGVVAARLRPGQGSSPELVAERPLPAGAVLPGLTETNVADAGSLVAALRQSLEAVGGAGREAALLLPDLAVRVALLEFEELPHHAEELDALVRFRLRKTLPFDAEQAALAVQVMRSGLRRGVVAVTASRERLNEYEDAFAAAGGRAAQVLPAGLAALMARAELGHGTLLLRWRSGALTSGFGWEQLPRLFRVIPTADGLVYDDLHASAAFFRDFLDNLPPQERIVAPRILTFGIPEAVVAELQRECDWARVSTGASAWGGAESHLAVAGALQPDTTEGAMGARPASSGQVEGAAGTGASA